MKKREILIKMKWKETRLIVVGKRRKLCVWYFFLYKDYTIVFIYQFDNKKFYRV